jgi:Tol biopolymer transport system component
MPEVRRFTPLALVVLMALFGLGVYHALGLFKTDTTQTAAKPTDEQTQFILPGTLYLTQDGAIYSLHDGHFTRITASQRGWQQPSLLPDGRLLAVARGAQSSDVYTLNPDGSVAQQLTQNAARGAHASIDLNHWSFYPVVSPDGDTLFTAYDEPKSGYMVDLAIWSRPLSSPESAQRRWTMPNEFTGGDIMPVPLSTGGILYVKYAVDSKERITSRIWLQARPGSAGVPLTGADDDCLWPALSPDEHRLAMVCTGAQQQAQLELVPFDGARIGPARVLVNDRLTSAPLWSPDGKGIAYLAPASAGGGFQLWWLDSVTSKHAAQPVQVTVNLALDASSRPAWAAN